MTMGQRLKALRDERGLTQERLADDLGVSKSTIGMYETDKREPNIATLEAIADYFNVDMDYLHGKSEFKNRNQWLQQINRLQRENSGSGIPPGFKPLPDMVEVPLVGRIACGQPITAQENLEGYVSIPAEWHATFTLTCTGDRMEPTIHDGDLVAIRKDVEVENGQIAAVRIEDEATLKRIYLHEDYIELRPENPNYGAIIRRKEEMNDVTIEGKAVGLCRGL